MGVMGLGFSIQIGEDIVVDMWSNPSSCKGVGIEVPHKESMGFGWYVGTCLVEEGKGVCSSRFKVRTMFRGEVYGEDIKVLGLSYGGTPNFDGQATRVGPITHSGVWEEVV